MMNEKPKRCFVISPIGEEGSDTRKRSDQVLNHIIKPVAIECGYIAVRADEIDKPGLITSQVIQRVVSDELVIADLTETNPNVFYELAVRHAYKKPFIQLIKKGEKIPFDVAGTRTIYFDHRDLDSVQETKDTIKRQIAELEKGSDVETPISVSEDLVSLRQSDNPEDRERAEIIGEMSQLRSMVSNIQEMIVEDLKEKSIREFGERSKANRNYLDHQVAKKAQFIIEDLKNVENKGLTLLVLCGFIFHAYPWIYKLAEELISAVNKKDVKLASEVYNVLQINILPSINVSSESEGFILRNIDQFLTKEYYQYAQKLGVDILDEIPF